MLFKKTLLYIAILSVILTNTLTRVFAEPSSEISSESMTETTTAATEGTSPQMQLPVQAEACILIDANSGIILYQKNAHEKLYPASITKIMTTLLACENGKMNDTITHSHNAVFNIGPGSSHIGMDEGEQVNFEDALYGIILESANEVCMAVAEHIDGTVEKFVERMNKKAAELGCKDTHFANPHGFHDDNHYTTCYDMSLITRAAIRNEEFLKIFSTVNHTIPPTNKNVERYLHNKDKMMRPTSPYYYENIIGGKTGFHDQALNTLVTYAGKDDIKLITVVMKDNGANLTYSDTKTLMEYGFSLFETKTLVSADSYRADIPVIQQYKDKTYDLGTVSLKLKEDYSLKVPRFIDTAALTLKPDLSDNIPAPVIAGTKVGTLNIYYDDCLLGSAEVVTATGLDAVPQSELEHRENIEKLKAFAIKAIKVLGIAIVVIAILTIIFKIISLIRRKNNRRRRKIYSYSGRYKTSPKKKKIKYKFKLK